ncbi:RxLR effector protein [Phytophthora megakarya]|uniref:RxLR effector protein n=1 Tax=Phytophthora megakarya TaxID=4795 RepID=A0A225VT18_9STRA|nr:RxLR effector protein [Phytophthora megakarya]
MRFLLLLEVVFFVTGVLSANVETKQTKLISSHDAAITSHDDNFGKSLRFAKTFHEYDDATKKHNSFDEEERVNPMSTILSKISANMPIKVKLNWWEILGKSNNYVKKKLGLENMKGEELKKHAHFRYYLKYVDDTEEFALWQKVDTSTYQVWKDLGLENKVKTIDDLEMVRGTDEFRKYKRFVNIFDKNMADRLAWGSRYHPPRYADPHATEVEWFVRAGIWGEAKRDDQFVKRMLGLMHAKGVKLNENKYYQYYLNIFQKTDHPPPADADFAALRASLLAS